MRKALHFEEPSNVEEHLRLMGNDTWPRGARITPVPTSALEIDEGAIRNILALQL